MTAVDLGVPVVGPRRRTSRQVMVGDVPVGGGAPVTVQSMTTTVTADVEATLRQIAELTAAGCQIVRVAVPSADDADALADIAKKSPIPVVADIHFQPRYVFAAIDAGCAAVRVNPGNIKKFDDRVAEIARAAADAGVPIRIGVNAGSLDARLLAKYGRATPKALARCDYPLHLGVTEAGPRFPGTIKSAVAFGCRCPPRRWKRSGSDCPFWNRWRCGRGGWRSCRARRADGRRSTCTAWRSG